MSKHITITLPSGTTVTCAPEQVAEVQALFAVTDVAAPAVAKATKAPKTARKTKVRKAASTTIEGKTCLVQANRKQFIADHDWAQPGTSTNGLVQLVADGAELTGNWAIGPRYATKYGIDQEADAKPANKPAKKGKKAKKAKAAKVEAKPKATVYRRANGTIAPKGEWAIRAILEGGGLSRAEVDTKTAEALAVLG